MRSNPCDQANPNFDSPSNNVIHSMATALIYDGTKRFTVEMPRSRFSGEDLYTMVARNTGTDDFILQKAKDAGSALHPIRFDDTIDLSKREVLTYTKTKSAATAATPRQVFFKVQFVGKDPGVVVYNTSTIKARVTPGLLYSVVRDALYFFRVPVHIVAIEAENLTVIENDSVSFTNTSSLKRPYLVVVTEKEREPEAAAARPAPSKGILRRRDSRSPSSGRRVAWAAPGGRQRRVAN